MTSVVSVVERLPVVVGVDGMPADLQVVDVAAEEAAFRGVPLHVVHAWPGRLVTWSRHRVAADQPDGRHLLDLAIRRAQLAYPSLIVGTQLVDEGAAETLVRWSARAGLLVVRHRDEAGLGHGWGSTAAYVAHHSVCPLLVHRGAAPPRGPVVVAVSGRHTASLRCAFEAAARVGCGVTAVHVKEPGVAGGDHLEKALAEWSGQWPQVPVERLLIDEDEVAYTIDRASHRCRLLVAGRGRKGWSVEAVYNSGGVVGVRQVCPVLLVPPGWPVAGRVPAYASQPAAH
ncbi:nucleotide-binding universal stress UspA family protein [Actinoplanes campanulatus]|uniref:Nucleotide-binding universal stress UspA family protein n=1 Tax=Actinoplanes campanulatus TaxID=113559 RepID=A0A7W5FEE4_9ACTN|nr:universal stress protein [Actinoplanes campanulatus]MBB3095438.1 nucleotide-binding universal stress UspA family protein [Actinoplanes campanulatus]GGN08980.1 universal stress protein [Actinoplanes campanulatus]GID36321.1 universal stress protein [Actinoplanes campanulatus]